MQDVTCPNCFVVTDAAKQADATTCRVCGHDLSQKRARPTVMPTLEKKHIASMQKILGTSAYVRDLDRAQSIFGSWSVSDQWAFFADFEAETKKG